MSEERVTETSRSEVKGGFGTRFAHCSRGAPACVNGPPADAQVAQMMVTNGWEDIFYRGKVDIVLQGHYHVYYRTCSVYNNKCQPRTAGGAETAPVYFNTGWGGANTDAPTLKTVLYPNGTCIYPYFTKTSGPTPKFGFLKLRATMSRLVVEAVQTDWNCEPAAPDGETPMHPYCSLQPRSGWGAKGGNRGQGAGCWGA